MASYHFTAKLGFATHKYKMVVHKMKNMSIRKFTLQIIRSSEGGFTGRCLELPTAISEGDTIEELESNMKEVIQLVLESTRKRPSRIKRE